MMPIYFDHAATTQVCLQAAEAAFHTMTEGYGNPSSRHALGTAAAQQLKGHRQTVAQALGCLPEEFFFTSCGTESNSWAIRGAVDYGKRVGKHLITTAIEHSAVLAPMATLEQKGYEVTRLKPDASGHISPDALEQALRPDTVLVSMMLVNNELGTIQPVRQAAEAIRTKKSSALLHSDAVQGFLKVPFTPKDLGVDLLSITGHKIRAPKGVGGLYIRKELIAKWKPMLAGGGQEGGLRAGTEATPQIAALAAACDSWDRIAYTQRMQEVKDYALEALSSQVKGLKIISRGEAPHICAVSLVGYPAEMLVRELSDRGIYLSSGSACHKGKPSHVFATLPLSKQEKMGVLRISFGPDSTREEVNQLVTALQEATSNRIAVN